MSGIREQIPLASYTWWKIGGLADHMVEPKSVADLAEAMRVALQSSWPLTVLGGGSNILVSDRGIEGLTILLRSLNAIESVREVDGRLEIIAQAGANKAELTKILA